MRRITLQIVIGAIFSAVPPGTIIESVSPNDRKIYILARSVHSEVCKRQHIAETFIPRYRRAINCDRVDRRTTSLIMMLGCLTTFYRRYINLSSPLTTVRHRDSSTRSLLQKYSHRAAHVSIPSWKNSNDTVDNSVLLIPLTYGSLDDKDSEKIISWELEASS